MRDFEDLGKRIAEHYGVQYSELTEEWIAEACYGLWGESLEMAQQIIDWYRTTKSPSRAMLIEQRKKLAGALFYIAAMVGQAGRVYRSYHIKRKANYSEFVFDQSEELGAVSKAEHKANFNPKVLSYKKKEADAEASHEKGRMLYASIRETLSAMMQEISNLKDEQYESRYD